MRLNDFGLLAIVLLAGLLVGIVGTLAVYSSVASRQGEAEQKEAQETIRNLQEERDQLQAKINDYVAAERDRNQAGEQPVAVENVPQDSEIAAAPRRNNGSPSRPEVVLPPREDKSTAKAKPVSSNRAPGYGPPRDFGNKTDR